jgi:hypothetical protein
VVLPTPRHKSKLVMKGRKGPPNWIDCLDKRRKLRNMGIRLCTWNVRSLYRAGSLMTVSRRVSKYKLPEVGVQEVRWDRGSTESAHRYKFFYGKGNEIF